MKKSLRVVVSSVLVVGLSLSIAVYSGPFDLSRGDLLKEGSFDRFPLSLLDLPQKEKLMKQIITDLCPYCSTTSRGGTITVTFGGNSSSQDSEGNQKVIDYRDNSASERIADDCNYLTDRYEKNVVVKKDDETVAVCLEEE